MLHVMNIENWSIFLKNTLSPQNICTSCLIPRTAFPNSFLENFSLNLIYTEYTQFCAVQHTWQKPGLPQKCLKWNFIFEKKEEYTAFLIVAAAAFELETGSKFTNLYFERLLFSFYFLKHVFLYKTAWYLMTGLSFFFLAGNWTTCINNSLKAKVKMLL